MGKIMKGLTIGGIIGFVAGMLFAPQKGEDSRKQLQDAVEKGKEKLRSLKQDIIKKKEEE